MRQFTDVVSTIQLATETPTAPFAGPGEMPALCQSFDWSSTPLGPISAWSQSLRTMADAVLASRNPMLLFWGPELIQIYNDAFRPSLGPATGSAPRHPRALGMRAADFWTDVWPTIGPQIEAVMTRGESVWHEDLYLPIERGDGLLDDAWWTYSYSPVRDDDGRINGTLIVCLETTATVRARQATEFERNRLKDLFRHAPAFICVVRGPDHVFEMTNDNYQRLIGFRDVIGKPVRAALPEVEGQGLVELLDNVLATGEPYIGEAVPIHVQRGPNEPLQQRFLNFVYQAITEPDGSRSGVFVHGVDVTEPIQMRADADAARRAAEMANRAKSDFLAIMSHELRTPLNAIDGYAELLELGVHGPLTEAQRDDIGRIRRSERHLLGLINDILNYTRIEAGAVRYHLENIGLEEILIACDAFTAPQRRAKGLDLNLQPCAPGLKVYADAEKVQQIVLNLLTNAIKFTDPPGHITVSCTANDKVATLSIVDTGKGISPEQLERIFEPFVQVDVRLTRAQEGVGLGLAISRDLARGMKGDVMVQSEPGKGSTFTLILPVSEM
ncbi:MAG TPA: ATP-binding protein [Longimicrobiales bacterium]|nr:ATP-binding protein [Longimicrobiales bacterium]